MGAEATSPEELADTTSGRDRYQLLGTVLAGKYRVLEMVGAGGFGFVYRGEHTAFDEPIAIKCLEVPRGISDDEKRLLMKRLAEEGAVLHRLSKRSAAIVQALDVGEVETPSGDWLPYLVLEWLDGETLAQHLHARRLRKEPPMSMADAVAMLEPAAKALAMAHSQGVAHRDIKPENLLFTGGELKVLDFGIAKVVGSSAFTAAPAATEQRRSAFTPNYGAPEQFNKRLGATGPWTDVFALALVLIEMTTGKRALRGDDVTQLYVAATDPRERPTPRSHDVDVGDSLEAVFVHALAIEPKERLPDAGALWHALEAALAASPTHAAPTPAVTPADLSETSDFLVHHALPLQSEPPPSSVDTTAPTAPAVTTPTVTRPAVSTPATAATVPEVDMVTLIDLANEGMPITVANVVARTRRPTLEVEGALEAMAQSGRLARHSEKGPASYLVAGLTVPLSTRLRSRAAPFEAIAKRWLHVDPALPPTIPPAKQKSVPFGTLLATFIPGFGLLYAAPFWTTLLLTIAGAITLSAVEQVPVVGVVLKIIVGILLAILSGILGAAYTWHYNRAGRRTSLSATPSPPPSPPSQGA